MRALIFELADRPGTGALEVAGLPLLVRQLQWLRDHGIEDVVVEVALGPSASELGALLLGSDPLVARCQVVPSQRPLGLEELAARAGLAPSELFLALPANLLLSASFALPDSSAHVRLGPPPFAAEAPPVALTFRTRGALPEGDETDVPGWAYAVQDLATAHVLTCAVLAGQAEGVLVHAAEVRPGVWLARGARVAEDAALVPPLLLGAEARVFTKARLGPNVVLGRRALVEREVVLSEVQVASATLVGEGARIRQAHVDAHSLTSLVDGARTEIRDRLLLSSTAYKGPSPIARAAALLVWLGLGAIWIVAALIGRALGRRALRTLRFQGSALHVGTLGMRLLDLVPALYDVVVGRRDLVGVGDPEVLALHASEEPPSEPPLRAGAIDVARSLAPPGHGATLLSMWRWYLRNKAPALDRQLLRAVRRGPHGAPS